MYDFSFGSIEKIKEDPEKFLIFVKRLLPRWANGIPDSECLAIFRVLNEFRGQNPVLIETGSGASSIAMFLHCALYGGEMYSWDTNGSKGSYLRSVVSESIGRVLGVDVHKIWKFIAFNSTDKNVGISVLSELGKQANFGYFDSWHTLDHLLDEISAFETVASKDFIIALDDAYFKKRHTNYQYVNMLRNKLALGPVTEPVDNICRPYYLEINDYLSERYRDVTFIEDTYKKEFKDDVFFEYYSGDRDYMNLLGLEEEENLNHRFDAIKVRS